MYCMYVCMYILYVCMYVCMYICLYSCVNICVIAAGHLPHHLGDCGKLVKNSDTICIMCTMCTICTICIMCTSTFICVYDSTFFAIHSILYSLLDKLKKYMIFKIQTKIKRRNIHVINKRKLNIKH